MGEFGIAPNGRYDASFYDRRYTNNLFVDLTYATSSDGGATWSTARVSTSSFDPSTWGVPSSSALGYRPFIGDYNGLVSRDDWAGLTWTGVAAPQPYNLEIYFAKVRQVVRRAVARSAWAEAACAALRVARVLAPRTKATSLSPGLRLKQWPKAPVLPRGFELPLEPRLPRIGSVDAVALEERAASLAKRSIKKEAKVFALELAVRMMDLTTLEGQDTPGKVAALASKAIRPDPSEPGVPSVAAICVYPNLVPAAVARVEGSSVKVASVATSFPSGQSPIELKLEEVAWVVDQGADEVDMVIDRGAFLSGRYAKVYDEIVRVKEASGDAHLKVILEVSELGTYDNVRRASLLAMAAGADFIKTSTGKLPGAATLPVTLCMLEAIRDVYEENGRMVGMKPAGGIRLAKQAVQYLVQLHETLGPDWLTPDLYRLGASSLLNDVLMQLRKEKTGVYQSPDYFTVD